MKSFFLLLSCITLFYSQSFAQTAIKPSGTGSDVDPYLIESLSNLYWVSTNSIEWNKHFLQTKDIDATECKTWKSGGWIPIGNDLVKFTGFYSGNKHFISNIYINNDTSANTGFFGEIENAEISRLRLLSVSIKGKNSTGSIAGYAYKSSISECGASGVVVGDMSVGGVVGICDNTGVSHCYSVCSVSGSSSVGGIAGSIYYNGAVVDSYAAGKVTGGNSGGLVGFIYLGHVYRNYWDVASTGQVIGYGYLNGLFEGNEGKTTAEMKMKSALPKLDFVDTVDNVISGIWTISPSVNNGYPTFALYEQILPVYSSLVTDFITATSAKIHLTVKEQGKSKVNSYGIYWSISNTNPDEHDNVIQLGTSLPSLKVDYGFNNLRPNTKYYIKAFLKNKEGVCLTQTSNFTTAILYDSIAPSLGIGTATDPYQIASLQNLLWLTLRNDVVSKHFIQTADIDASETKNWPGGGWIPIKGDGKTSFSGTYDGRGHTITGLTILNSPDYPYYLGLFANTYMATIKNIGLVDIKVSANSRSSSAGGLIGYSQETDVQNCFVTGAITKIDEKVGGLIGDGMYSNIKNCYAMVDVTGTSYVGGLIGWMGGGTTKNCYSTGLVLHDALKGAGLIGSGSGVTINNCFWDTLTSANSAGYSSISTGSIFGAAGKSTSEMQQIKTFTDSAWDFVGETINGTEDVWNINQSYNGGYPYLTWQKIGNISEIETKVSSAISAKSIVANGKLKSFGDIAPTEYGFCYNTTGNPDIKNGVLVKKQGIAVLGDFSLQIGELEQCRTYYMKAYAVNNFGVAYGSEVSFIVLDTVAPVVQWLHGDQLIATDPISKTTIIPDYSSLASVFDNCDLSELIITQAPSAGTEIAGNASVQITLTVTDAAGNKSVETFNATPKHSLSSQSLILEKGWNLISFHVEPSDLDIATLFKGTKISEIKTSNSFWKVGQPAYLNSLTKIELGVGYLVKADEPYTLVIYGTQTQTAIAIDSDVDGWQLINSTYGSDKPFSDLFNSTNCLYIKNFEGYWSPKDSQSNISNFEQGKAYYLKLKK